MVSITVLKYQIAGGKFLFIIDQETDRNINGNTSATLKTNTVNGFKGIPIQPITPAVMIRGMTLGIREHKSILTDLNKYNIQRAMSKKAQKILSFKPLMIKLLPSKKVMLVPVS